jgi:hypothetical protein
MKPLLTSFWVVKRFFCNFWVGFEGQQWVFSDNSQAVELQWSANTDPHTVHNSVDDLPKFSFRQDRPPLCSGIQDE